MAIFMSTLKALNAVDINIHRQREPSLLHAIKLCVQIYK